MSSENIYAGWKPEVVKRFKSWQMRTIVVSMIGYAIYYFVRKNFSIAMPGLTAQYGISNTSFGIVIGIGSLIYGLSRFINGFIVDRFSARVIMAIGLLLCAASNFMFGFGVNISSWITGVDSGPDFINMLIMLMAVTIVLNQYFQGVGYPPCARLLPSWIHPSQLATKMSIWNTSHSIGAASAVVVCGYIMGTMGRDLSGNPEIISTIAANLNLDPSNSEHMKTILSYATHWDAWKWCFWIPACMAVCGAAWLYFGLRDDPRSVGLPELPGTQTGKSEAKGDKAPSRAKFLKAMVWTNRWIWTLGIANVFVYVMRMGILDWGPKFLTEARNMSIEDAAYLPRQGSQDVFRLHDFRRDIHGHIHHVPAASYYCLDDFPCNGRFLYLWTAGSDRNCFGKSCHQGGLRHCQRPCRNLWLFRFFCFGNRNRYSC